MKLSDANVPSMLFDEQGSDPATPAAGSWRVYVKAGGLYIIDDAAVVSGPFGGGSVSDAAYGVGWDGDTTVAPSKNAVYDKIETLAPKDLQAVLASASTSLTNTTPNSLTPTYVQWGTEEAVIAQADCPTSAVVIVNLSGGCRPGPGGAAGDRGQIKMQVSFNGGSSFADLGSPYNVVLQGAANANTPVTYTARATGTVTGDIQVRAMILDVDAANDTTWVGGHITVLVHPQ